MMMVERGFSDVGVMRGGEIMTGFGFRFIMGVER